MNMLYYLNEDESKSIIKHFGRMFYEKVLKDVEVYSKKWKLEILQLVDYFSVNCIFTCRTEQYGNAILKIGNPSIEVFTEFNTLYEYNGKRFCKVFDSDIVNGVILEEQIKPGTRLREEKMLDKRLLAFSNLFNGLHKEPEKVSTYPTYFEWVSKITDYMKEQDDYQELYFYMEKAKNICASLCKVYSKRVLLHGDLHHDNILLGNNNEYKIIDPKGVIGDPIFDVPRFILNEFYNVDKISFEDYKNHIDKITSYLEKSLNISKEAIKKCVFIETTMANCWNVESSEAPEMDYVIYADAMI